MGKKPTSALSKSAPVELKNPPCTETGEGRTDGKRRPIRYGLLEGQGWIADDFDGPLPDDLQALFEGRDVPEK